MYSIENALYTTNTIITMGIEKGILQNPKP